jgi:protein SCO1/2
MQKRKWMIGAVVTIAILWMGLIALAKWVQGNLNAHRSPEAIAPVGLNVYWPSPDFSFLDQDGHRITNRDLRGHVWIADFFFSQCTSACPILTAKLLLMQKQIASPNIRFISFSVDPENDSPPVLKKYAQLWQGDESRWRLLSTDPAGLARVVSGMKVTVAPSGDKDNPILHSTLFMLIDQQGQVRGLYDSIDNDAITQLVIDAKSLDGSSSESPEMLHTSGGNAASRGQILFGSMGCVACHSQVRIAPPLRSLYGSMVRLDDKRVLWADEAYLHESIVDPNAKVVAGYARTMPSYRNILTDSQVTDLLAYLKSIGQPGAIGGHGVVSSPTTMPAGIELVMDPVCKMQVTADRSAPHLVYNGKTFFFCSEKCREQFRRNPAVYALTPTTSP